MHFRLADGGRASVEIAESCSGIYTMVIFISALSSFVLVEFGKFNADTTLLMGLGIVFAFIANLFRMAIIVIVGYYDGVDTMLLVHT